MPPCHARRRACPCERGAGHPRLFCGKPGKDVDGRDKRGHDTWGEWMAATIPGTSPGTAMTRGATGAAMTQDRPAP